MSSLSLFFFMLFSGDFMLFFPADRAPARSKSLTTPTMMCVRDLNRAIRNGRQQVFSHKLPRTEVTRIFEAMRSGKLLFRRVVWISSTNGIARCVVSNDDLRSCE